MIPPTLIGQATAFLAPFLPYLMENATAAGKEVAKKILGKNDGDPEAIWDKALDIWKILKPEVEAKPELAKDLQKMAKDAETDEEAKSAVSYKLKEIMKGMPVEKCKKIEEIITEKDSKADIIIQSYYGGVSIYEMRGGKIETGYYEGGKTPR